VRRSACGRQLRPVRLRSGGRGVHKIKILVEPSCGRSAGRVITCKGAAGSSGLIEVSSGLLDGPNVALDARFKTSEFLPLFGAELGVTVTATKHYTFFWLTNATHASCR
jgi:hypothetical protein